MWKRHIQLKIKNLAGANWAFEIIETSDNDHTIEAVTINDILTNYDIPHLDLLKIDVEGSEKEIFETNTDWI